MKKVLFLVILACTSLIMKAQDPAQNKSSLSFTHKYYECEGQWVVLPKKADADKYPFGFVYLDGQAGLTFEYEGEFKIDGSNKFTRVDNGPKTYSVKKRLGNTTNAGFALLPGDKIKELGLEVYPKILELYKINDPVAHDIALGRTLNGNDASVVALPYLEKAYSINPTADGVEFELGYAYNGLAKYKDAIRVLEIALKRKPQDILIYKELGFAYTFNGNYQEALTVYKKGITLDDKMYSGYKGEMIFHIAMIYKGNLKDEEQFKIWGTKALGMAAKNSNIYKTLISAGISPEGEKISNQTGSFKDERDGQVYKWVKIGNQTWMAQNLNFKIPDGSWAYNDDESNRATYGLFYKSNVVNQISPKGWHVPTAAEWQKLEVTLGMDTTLGKKVSVDKGPGSPKFFVEGSSGFNVLFGGIRQSGSSNQLGEQASFMTSTIEENRIYTRLFKKGDRRVYHNEMGSGYSHSVRCIKDDDNK